MGLKVKVSLVALAIAGSAVGGAVIGWELKPAQKLEPVVTVPDSALNHSKPEPPSGLAKVTQTTVKPAQVARSEGRPDSASVLRYCAYSMTTPATLAGAALPHVSGDASPKPEPVVTPKPILPSFAGTFHDRQLELHSTLSDGRLWRGTYAGVHPPFSFGSDADSVWVVQPRFWVRAAKTVGTCGKRAVLGGLLGGLLGGIIKPDGVKAGAIAGASVGCASALD